MFDLVNPITGWVRRGLLLAVALVVSGCGYSEYELRLGESRKYYSHLDKIEQSLMAKWVAPGGIMEVRVPRQFVVIPAPQPVKKENGEMESPGIDHRQPDYINLTFPGLFGAWSADFSVVKTDGTKEDRKGYIYALSNYDELAGEHTVDAGQFDERLKTLLAETLAIPVSDERQELHPKIVPAYQAQLTYDSYTFKGKNIDGVAYTFDVYARTQGSVKAVLVVVLPEGMESPQKVTERIPMMLEAFTFTKTPPKSGAAPAGAGGKQPAAPASF